MSFDPSTVCLIADRILVQRVDRGEKETPGGILIPDQAQELGDCAVVIAVGPGKRSENDPQLREPMDLSPGQVVIINRYSGTEFKTNGESYLVLRASDVLAVVND